MRGLGALPNGNAVVGTTLLALIGCAAADAAEWHALPAVQHVITQDAKSSSKADPAIPLVENVDITAPKAVEQMVRTDPRDRDPLYAFTSLNVPLLRVPAEHEPVSHLLLAIPYDALDLMPFYADLIRHARTQVSITILTDTGDARDLVLAGLKEAGIDVGAVHIEIIGLDSLWVRDFGPQLAFDRKRQPWVLDWRYYRERHEDDAVPSRLAARWQIPVARPPIELEGGNLLTDGHGRCIVTNRVLEQNAFWGLSKTDIEAVLLRYAGCTRTTFIPGLPSDPNSHADMMALIVRRGVVMVAQGDNDAYPEDAPRLEEAAERLRADGWRVIRVPLPSPDENRFRSYTNAVVINRLVVIPAYGHDPSAKDVWRVFRRAFPNHHLVALDAEGLVMLEGAIHCATRTLSAGIPVLDNDAWPAIAANPLRLR